VRIPVVKSSPAGLNILLVEDHPDTAQALRRYLEFCGHTVATAATCAEALAQANLARMEVLICDIGLPDCSGWDLLPQLRVQTAQAYAVAITAHGLLEDKARSLAAGFQAHLTKPFAPHALAELLNQCRR
jgi:two-component system, chemotaxis family, CheB/CheR fusion protein